MKIILQLSSTTLLMWSSVYFYLLGVMNLTYRVDARIDVDGSTTKLLHDKTNRMTCTPSEDSDQPGHLPNLISLCFWLKKVWILSYPFTAKTLIRLGGCPGWSESCWAHRSFHWFCHAGAHTQTDKTLFSDITPCYAGTTTSITVTHIYYFTTNPIHIYQEARNFSCNVKETQLQLRFSSHVCLTTYNRD